MINSKVVARLLARAYVSEFTESQVISEALVYIPDDKAWDELFRILTDNELHRIIIENTVRSLGYEVKDFQEYAFLNFRPEQCKDFSDELIPRILNDVLKWEVWAKKYYEKMLSLDFSGVSKERGDDAEKHLKENLKVLVEWEDRHIKTLEELINTL